MLRCHIVFEYFDILTVSLVEVGLRKKKIHIKRGILQQILVYYHKDHFYILFTLM